MAVKQKGVKRPLGTSRGKGGGGNDPTGVGGKGRPPAKRKKTKK